MKKLLLILLVIAILLFVLKDLYKSSEKIQTNTITPTIASPTTNRPIIGIHYKMIDKQTALQNNLIEGAYVTQVIKGSPAEKAKLQEEDIIIEIDGRITANLDEQSLYNLIITLKPGSQVNLKVWRNKEIKTIYVII
ncbi:MAG: PDZ domain-containing protein [Patescibacteria group bacterium]